MAATARRVEASGAKNFHLFEVNEEENGCALPLLRKKRPGSSATILCYFGSKQMDWACLINVNHSLAFTALLFGKPRQSSDTYSIIRCIDS